MNNQHRELLAQWIDELLANPIDTDRAQEIAQTLGKVMVSSAQMRNFATAVRGTIEDPLDCTACQELLPEFIGSNIENISQTELDTESLDNVRAHLMLCPYCTAAYVEVAEVTRLSLADAIPAVASYPEFDLSFLASSKSTEVVPIEGQTIKSLVQQALGSGSEWIGDVLGGITLVFGPGFQTQTEDGWVVKSKDASALLAQVILLGDDFEGWDIEGSVFADANDDLLCHVEVSLYNLENSDADLSGIPVVVGYGETEVNGETDAGGIAEFEDIPVEQIPQLGVHVRLPDKS